jgi:hypothetical protein
MKSFVLICVAFFCVAKLCLWQTGGFALAKMVTLPSPHLPPSTPLHFLGAGKQFYAFETKDRKTVYKFIKFSRRGPLPWLASLTLPPPLNRLRDSYLAARAKRLSHLRQSAHLAFERIPHQTGLLPLPNLTSPLTLIDNLGIAHTISSRAAEFFLQEKAVPFTDYFSAHLSLGQSLIDSYIATIATQCDHNLCNLDPLVERNYGVVGQRVIILDIGSFMHRTLTPIERKRQIFLELLPLRTYLLRHHREFISYFDASLKKKLSVD